MSQSVRVLQNRLVGPNAKVLRLQRQTDFVPGMVVGLSTDRSIPERLYSIASSNQDPWLEILYTKVEAGTLTPRLWTLQAGDQLWCSQARGTFVDTIQQSTFWIANGTGIAPFLAMAQSQPPPRRRFCLHSSRTLAGLYGRPILAAQAGLRYIACVTGPLAAPDDHIFNGRLTDWLQTVGAADLAAVERFMLCGSTGMIVEVREILMGFGISHHRIESEIYF